MSEHEISSAVARAEAELRDFGGRNLYTHEVENFADVILEIPSSPEAQERFEDMKEELLSLLVRHGQALPGRLAAKVNFVLGRLNFLAGDQEPARVHFHEAARNGMHAAVIYYHLAMTYAADATLAAGERRRFTEKFLEMTAQAAGPESGLGMEAALHIKLIAVSKF